MADEILGALADGIVTITLNRPERRNALNTAMLEELHRRFDELERDTRVRVVVIRGAGTAFCSGRDLDARRAYEMGMVHTVVPAAELERATYDLARTIAGNAPLSLAGMKATIRRSAAFRDRIEHADLDEVARRARASADAREGVRAMLDKRKPIFRGA